jgi:hydroxymethylbilane synthase
VTATDPTDPKPTPPGPGRDEGTIRIATRGSALALAQAELVAGQLREAWPGLDVELVVVVTEGDRRRDVPTSSLGGKGVFTAAVQQAVLDGRADAAVHSAKDLPAAQSAGLVLAAVPRREDPRDVLVAPGFPAALGPGDLPDGARIGTGSPRRVALIGSLWPELKAIGVRGNVDTRLRKARDGEVDAVILAAAGLRRLGLLDTAGAVPLDPETFVPAPGQACLAVEARADDTRALGLLSAITHRPARVALRGERAFLAKLGGSCTLPAGALLTTREGRIEMHGFLASIDGSEMVRDRVAGPPDDPESLGSVLADRLLDAASPQVRALVEGSR